ncbi:MAG TPA: sugar-binding protein [Ruminiclostridium sp.]
MRNKIQKSIAIFTSIIMIVSMFIVISPITSMADTATSISIQNAGFETGDATAWSWTTGKTNFSVTNENHHDGAYALKLLNPEGGWGSIVTSNLPVIENTDYTVTFWAKVPVAATYFNVVNESWTTLTGATQAIAISTDWQQYTMHFNSGTNTQVMLQIFDATAATGTLYFDDFVLTATEVTPTPTPVTNLIGDSGFESVSSGWAAWVASGEVNWSVTDQVQKSGTHSLMLSNASGNESMEYIPIDTSINTDYTLTFWSKTDIAPTLGISGPEVSVIDANNWETRGGPVQMPKDIGEWTKYTVNFNSGASIKIQIILKNVAASAGGTFYFDDFILAGPPPVQSTEQVVNVNDAKTNNDAFIPNLPQADLDNTRNWNFSTTFSDEFNGTTLDLTKWLGNSPNWYGRQPSIFDSNNVKVGNGNLTLSAKYVDEMTPEMIEANSHLAPTDPQYHNYTTALVSSNEASGYGYYEIRAKTAEISIGSNFWFQGTGTEIDVYEQTALYDESSGIYTQYKIPTNTHDFSKGWANDVANPITYTTTEDTSEDYHTYGLDWNANWIRIYFDNTLIRETKNVGFNESERILFDMETYPGFSRIPPKEDFTGSNGDYNIDYIRVWRSANTGSATPLMPKAPTKLAHAVKGTPAIVDGSGTIDPIWNSASEIGPLHVKNGSSTTNGKIKTMWDDDFLYVLAQITDSDLVAKDAINNFQNDSFEIYIDSLNEKATTAFDTNDFVLNADITGKLVTRNLATDKIPYISKDVKVIPGVGYNVQFAIPWVDVTPETGKKIGFEIQINDATTLAGQRTGYLGWNDMDDNIWQKLENSGDLELNAAPIIPPTEYVTVEGSKVRITVGEPVLDNNTKTAKTTISDDIMKQALALAKPDSHCVKQIVVTIPKVEGTRKFTVELPAYALTSKNNDKKIEIQTQLGTIDIPGNMFKASDIKGAGSIQLSIGMVDKTGLKTQLKKAVGDRPIIELTAAAGDRKISWNNPKAPVTVSIDYQPTAAELKAPNHIVVQYIDGKGNINSIPNGRYDATSGKVIFTTTHFGMYTFDFVNKTCKDLSNKKKC